MKDSTARAKKAVETEMRELQYQALRAELLLDLELRSALESHRCTLLGRAQDVLVRALVRLDERIERLAARVPAVEEVSADVTRGGRR